MIDRPSNAVEAEPPPREIVEIPVLLEPVGKAVVPPKTRIVIMGLQGPCSGNVKDALVRRLVENTDYQVLTRENLRQILRERDMQWAGDFNTHGAVQIGELLGASMFVVGRVLQCEEAYEPATGELRHLTMQAALQILDLDTGRVVASSASRGTYEPGDENLLYAYAGNSPPGQGRQSSFVDKVSSVGKTVREGLSALNPLSLLTARSDRSTAQKQQPTPETRNRFGESDQNLAIDLCDPCNDPLEQREVLWTDHRIYRYEYIRAAQELANQFADRFFTRPTWEKVEMWPNLDQRYGEVIREVKLGRCELAVERLETIDHRSIPELTVPEVAELLHNQGVALLCANRLGKAIAKLQAAYRISYNPSTLRMVDLANRMDEWALAAAADREPLMVPLLTRDDFFGPSVPKSFDDSEAEQEVSYRAPGVVAGEEIVVPRGSDFVPVETISEVIVEDGAETAAVVDRDDAIGGAVEAEGR